MIIKWLVGTAAVVGVAAISVGIALTVVDPPAGEAPDSRRVLAAAPTAGGGGPSEGIKVHGDWVIDVLDPDGTLVEHKEFENAFQGAGAKKLAQILAGEETLDLSPWRIKLYHRVPGVASLDNRSVSPTASVFEDDKVQLNMSTTLPETEDREIFSVLSTLNGFNFTATTLPEPILITSGQQILATVTISFS